MLGVFAGHDFARGLVVEQDAGDGTGRLSAQWAPINPNEIRRPNALPDVRGLAIDRYPAGENQLLHVPS